MKIFVITVITLVSSVLLAQDCELQNLQGQTVATVKTNGAVGAFGSSGLTLAGISHRDVISGRSSEVFGQPRIFRRGDTAYCVMPSLGWSETDGLVYNFAGQYLGYVTDEGVFNSSNQLVGQYNEACAALPQSLRFRLVGAAARVVLFRNSAVSDYMVGYNPEACSFGYHPGIVKAKVLIRPIGCPNCGYTYTPIH